MSSLFVETEPSKRPLREALRVLYLRILMCKR